jgi:hypothetical protein
MNVSCLALCLGQPSKSAVNNLATCMYDTQQDVCHTVALCHLDSNCSSLCMNERTSK